MENNKSSLLQAQDNFDRLLVQTQALVTITCSDGHFANMGERTLGNILWLIDDRIGDMGKAYEEVVKQAERMGVIHEHY
jgi:hypothetical protein